MNNKFFIDQFIVHFTKALGIEGYDEHSSSTEQEDHEPQIKEIQ